MLDSPSAVDTLALLRRAMSADTVPHALQKQARTLAERLAGGVRIALLGPSGVGKSQLCNALMGVDAQQTGKARCFVPDACDITPVAQNALPDQFAFDVMRSDRLGHAQLLDTSTPAEHWPQHTQQVLAHIDIVLWCTEEFTQQEAGIWAAVPDALKDHSFLVLTKADALAARGTLASRMAALQDIASDEFHGFFPTSTAQLSAARAQAGSVSEAQFAASGVKALAEAVMSIAASGQRADLDSALLFIERYGLSASMVGASDQQVVSAAQNTGKSVLPVVLGRARAHLTERALDLAELTFDADQSDLSDVLELCGTISEELVEIVADTAHNGREEQKWQSAFEEASDKVVLMSMENDQRSAADAVSILLQLRRDLDFLATQAA